jgi:hypothetical protein
MLSAKDLELMGIGIQSGIQTARPNNNGTEYKLQNILDSQID